MLAVFAILLVRIGVPHFLAARQQAKAGRIADAARAARDAADRALTAQGAWPADVAAGTVPPELARSGGAVTFSTPDFVLDWDMIVTEVRGEQFVTPAIIIRPTDSTLVSRLERAFGRSAAHLVTPTSYTLILAADRALVDAIVTDATAPPRETRRCVVTPGARRAPPGTANCLGAQDTTGGGR